MRVRDLARLPVTPVASTSSAATRLPTGSEVAAHSAPAAAPDVGAVLRAVGLVVLVVSVVVAGWPVIVAVRARTASSAVRVASSRRRSLVAEPSASRRWDDLAASGEIGFGHATVGVAVVRDGDPSQGRRRTRASCRSVAV